MDQKTEFVSQVVSKMSDYLSNEQLTLLEANLIVATHGIKIEKECTDLVAKPRDWDWYLSRFRATKRLKNCAESTLKQYEYTISKFREYVYKLPQDVTCDDVKYFLAMFGNRDTATTKKPVSKVYINNAKNNLGAFFSWMSDEGYISKNPINLVPKIKIPKAIKRAYNGEDLEKMKSHAGSKRNLALLYFLDATGLRISEAVSVNRGDINWDKRSVIVYGTKGKAEREVLFTEECAYRLKDYLSDRIDQNVALFVKSKKPYGRLTKSGAEYIVRTIGKKSGVHAHPHRFRRTMITRCSRRGMDLQDIQRLAGHTNASTTQIYIDLQNSVVKSSYDRFA